ncbi:MAG: hypothetical protein IJT54_04125, partial [Candidatus Methanomethylophilaceae archaeon]|nr:hypothetical protein [Candidatus Methanomethylophilaceae archaeon]
MTQYSLEMMPLQEDWRPKPKDYPKVRAYRFSSSSPANLVDQVALTTDLKKSEFVAASIRLGALFVRFAG